MSVLICFLFFKNIFFSGIEQVILLIVMPGLFLSLFIRETTFIKYSKLALRESLIFGLIFGVIFGNFFLFFDREDGMSAVTVWNVSFTILFFLILGFALSFFGVIVGIIPKYFASLRIRR